MARRPGLGKGLEALIPGSEEEDLMSISPSHQGVIQIPITQIQPNPQQPRIKLNEETLQELAASIREHGIIQPLIVSETNNDTYTIVAGERRWRAAIIVGLTMVPVILRNVTEQEELELALIENLQREDLTPLEMADAYRSLIENFSLTHDRIAESVGKSRTSVTNTLRLLNLPQEVKSALSEEIITEGHARALLGLPTPKAQIAALSTLINHGLNVRQTEALVKKLGGEKPPMKQKPIPSPEVQALENQLMNYFGTKVNLRETKNGGRLVIHYYSDEELNEILEKILPE